MYHTCNSIFKKSVVKKVLVKYKINTFSLCNKILLQTYVFFILKYLYQLGIVDLKLCFILQVMNKPQTHNLFGQRPIAVSCGIF